MATQLNKTKFGKGGKLLPCNVTRQLASTDNRGRPLIVELGIGDTITFRSKGKRTKFTMHLSNVYYMAMINHLQERQQEKLKAWKGKKEGGMRTKRPRALRIPTSPDMLQALAMKK